MLFARASLLFLCCFGTAAFADSIELGNGDRISGVVIQKLDDRVKIAAPYAGLIQIFWKDVVAISIDRDITVVTNDDKEWAGSVTSPSPGQLVIDQQTVNLNEVRWINPPGTTAAKRSDAQVPISVSGTLRAGAVATTGNSDTSNINLQAEIIAKKDKNRLTAGMAGNFTRANGTQTGENYNGYLRYDRYRDDHWFGSANLALTHDKFANLKLRTTLGLGLGYRFWEHAKGQLETEVGLNIVHEDRDNAANNTYPALRWGGNFEKWFGTHSAQIFFNHELLQSLSDGTDRVINARTGIRVPLFNRWSASFETHVKWDYSPVPGNESADINYIMALGYRL